MALLQRERGGPQREQQYQRQGAHHPDDALVDTRHVQRQCPEVHTLRREERPRQRHRDEDVLDARAHCIGDCRVGLPLLRQYDGSDRVWERCPHSADCDTQVTSGNGWYMVVDGVAGLKQDPRLEGQPNHGAHETQRPSVLLPDVLYVDHRQRAHQAHVHNELRDCQELIHGARLACESALEPDKREADRRVVLVLPRLPEGVLPNPH
mmetsp:Transcript_77331/g.201550  ORF Transcript_77331/g.201550 Transcript_77331/m.201550 type:complete len:208 (-) Transcript_77331:881-1504(-)